VRYMHNRARSQASSVLSFFALVAIFLFAITILRIGIPMPVEAQTKTEVAPAKTKVNPKDGLTYVFIPAGTFQMGCSAGDADCLDAEKPPHSVTISTGFWIGQTPVTQAAYKKVMNANPSRFPADQQPVEYVPWQDAQSYCGKVDMRLPTEAEWEYAARGGTTVARPGPVDAVAWYNINSKGTPHPVALKQANGYGLYDTLGNVWEWVADWWGPYTAAAATDPKGPPTGQSHVLRGGSRTGADTVIRVSSRSWLVPGMNEDIDYGFRCAGN
jgi:formylglycine-generating enzyme required for sulfatase activity